MEIQEKTDEQAEFEKAVRPLMQYLAGIHPHHTVIVTATTAELCEGERVFRTDDYIID